MAAQPQVHQETGATKGDIPPPGGNVMYLWPSNTEAPAKTLERTFKEWNVRDRVVVTFLFAHPSKVNQRSGGTRLLPKI